MPESSQSGTARGKRPAAKKTSAAKRPPDREAAPARETAPAGDAAAKRPAAESITPPELQYDQSGIDYEPYDRGEIKYNEEAYRELAANQVVYEELVYDAFDVDAYRARREESVAAPKSEEPAPPPAAPVAAPPAPPPAAPAAPPSGRRPVQTPVRGGREEETAEEYEDEEEPVDDAGEYDDEEYDDGEYDGYGYGYDYDDARFDEELARRRRRPFIIAGCVLLALLIGLAAFLLLRGGGSGSLGDTVQSIFQPDIDEGAQAWSGDQLPSRDEEQSQSQSVGIKIPGYPSITIPADAEDVYVALLNPEGNPCYFTFQLLLKDTDEVLYTSKMVPPGTVITEITLSRPLSAGEYDAVIRITTNSLEDGSAMNGADVETLLIAQ